MAYSLSDAAALVPSPYEDEAPADESKEPKSWSYMSVPDFISGVIVPPEEKRSDIARSFKDFVSLFTQSQGEEDDVKELTRGALASIKQISGLKNEAAKQDHDGTNMVQRLIEKGLIKVVKFVLKKVLKGVARFVLSMFRRIIVWGMEALIDWVVEPMLVTILELIGVNPELWPFIAIAGGIIGLGYGAYKMFFDDTGPSTSGLPPDETKESLDATRAEANAPMAKAQQLTTAPTPPSTNRPVAPTTVTTTPSVKSQGPTTRPEKTTQVKHAAPAQAAAAPVAAAPPPTGNDADIKKMIMRHEGVKTKPYKDSLGLWTIGVGHLIGDGHSLPDEWNREFSMQEIMDLFDKDYPAYAAAAAKIPNFDKLNSQGRGALIDITYNMGQAWWHKWKQFTKFMQAFDIPDAVSSLTDSIWYKQVGRRAQEDIGLLASNEDATKSAADTAKVTPGVSVQPPPKAGTQPSQQVAQSNQTAMPAPSPETQVVKVGNQMYRVAA